MARGWRLGRLNDGNGNDSGHVRVYEYMAVLGLSLADIDGEAAGDHRALGLPVKRWHAGGDWGAYNDGNGITQATCGSMSTWQCLDSSLAGHRRRGGR